MSRSRRSHTHIEELVRRRPRLAACETDIGRVCDLLDDCYRRGGKVLVCGNGGSCSDAGHIVGELMKGFRLERPLPAEVQERLARHGGAALAARLQAPLRAIDLTAMTALNTAVANDIGADYVYAQQVIGLADPGDLFAGISTSGNSENVHNAALAAKAMGAVLVGLTGADGGRMRESGLYDVLVRVPETETCRIQEEHIAVYHAVCMAVEDMRFGSRTERMDDWALVAAKDASGDLAAWMDF